MGLRINTNLASIAAQHQLSKSQRKNEGAMKALASGNRFDNPGESSAQHAIGENLRGQIAGMKSAKMNAENAYSFIQVAEGGLNEQNNILIRLRELAVQSASDTISSTEREFIQEEGAQLTAEFDRIAETTSFGSNKLLNGDSREYEFQVGAYGSEDNRITYKADTDTRASSLNVDSINLDDKSDARDALETVDEALTKVAGARSRFGAIQSRLDSVVNNQNNQIENLEAARSRVADTDVAESVSQMYKQQALQQYQISILSEANRFPQNVIRLIA